MQCLQTTDWSENTATPLPDFRRQFDADTCKVYTRSSQTQQSSETRNLQRPAGKITNQMFREIYIKVIFKLSSEVKVFTYVTPICVKEGCK